MIKHNGSPWARLLLGAALASASAWASAAVNCAIPSQRDSTCVGSLNSTGTRPGDNGVMNPVQRGSNAKPILGVSMIPSAGANSCVTVPFVSWSYDPQSYGTPPASFITPAGNGYLGSGGMGNPTDTCASDADGSCAAWVPATHPYLLTGNSTFSQCAGAQSQGSIACSVSGKYAYVTTSLTATYFTAHMIACQNNTATSGMTVLGSPIANWRNCGDSTRCSYSLIYPRDEHDYR